MFSGRIYSIRVINNRNSFDNCDSAETIFETFILMPPLEEEVKRNTSGREVLNVILTTITSTLPTQTAIEVSNYTCPSSWNDQAY